MTGCRARARLCQTTSRAERRKLAKRRARRFGLCSARSRDEASSKNAVVMRGMSTPSRASLSDAALLAQTVRAAGAERRATVDLVAFLAEADARRLYLGQGSPSLFAWCTGALRLSEPAANTRITAARAARRYPAIVTQLAEGDLSLSTVTLLAAHLTDENHEALPDGTRGKSKCDVERLIASLVPQPDIASSPHRRKPRRSPPSSARPHHRTRSWHRTRPRHHNRLRHRTRCATTPGRGPAPNRGLARRPGCACLGSLPPQNHPERRRAGQPRTGPRPAAPRPAHRRTGPHRRARIDGPGRAARDREVRRRTPSSASGDDEATACADGGQARGVGARPGTLRVCRRGWPVPRNRLARAPPRGALCARRADEGRQSGTALPRP